MNTVAPAIASAGTALEDTFVIFLSFRLKKKRPQLSSKETQPDRRGLSSVRRCLCDSKF